MTDLLKINATMPLGLDDAVLSSELDSIYSETTPAERRFLYHFFSVVWQGEKNVCEMGPFLGGTTKSIAMGMLANPRRHPRCRLYTYDKFFGYYEPQRLVPVLEPYLANGTLTNDMLEKIQRGEGFKEIFIALHRDKPYSKLLVPCQKVLPQRASECVASEGVFGFEAGLEFDAVVVDGCKSWYATKHFMTEISRCTHAGSYFIFQDYGWYTCFWIPAFVSIMKENFRLLAYVDGLYAFQLRTPLNPVLIDERYPNEPQGLGKGFFDQLFGSLLTESCNRNDIYALVFHSLQHAAALAYLGYLDEAKRRIIRLSAQPYAQAYQPLIQQALRSPTYTPDGPIYLPQKSETSLAPEIIGVRPHLTGAYVKLHCRKCDHIFENYQPTVAGIALGRHVCPRCHAVYRIMPEDFEAALNSYLPSLSFEEMVELTNEASRIAETWYRTEPLAELLRYKGINLGEPAERNVLSFITLGLYTALKDSGRLEHERS